MVAKPGVLGKTLLIGVAMLSLGEHSANAQTAGASPAGESAGATEQSLDTIVVTGTRRLDRTIADSPVPVDVIDTTALKNQGATNELGAVLNDLVPSFNFPRPSQSDGTDMVRVATLRGLGPDQTLVLIDGKRRHASAITNDQFSIGQGSSGVDLNAIPVSAIKRIEVLRDGAAAQYGSDAIAGVINIILKDNAEGGDAAATIGKYYTTIKGVPKVTGLQSVNGQPVVDFVDGFGTNVFKANTAGNRTAQDGATYNISADIGLPLSDHGFANVALEVAHRDATNRSGAELGQNYNTLPSGAFDPRELTFNRLDGSTGDGTEMDHKLFVNTGYKIDESTKVYLFANDSHRTGTGYQYYRNAGQASDNGGRDCDINLPALSNGACQTFPFYPNGFLPVINSTIDDYQVVAGVKGKLADWHYDASLNDGHDRYDFGTGNTINTTLGEASPRSFNDGSLAYGQTIANLDLQREFSFTSTIQNLSVAGGLEYRREHYTITPGEPASYAAIAGVPFSPPGGSQSFPGFANPEDQYRHNVAAYVDLDADVNDRWELSAAAREEKYSDFGSNTSGKLATRYKLTDSFTLRGAVSSGFRAPSLQQEFYQTQASVSTPGGIVLTNLLPVSDPAAQALGAKPLKPETSRNFSTGFSWAPLPRTTLSMDVYRIDIDNRIALSDALNPSFVPNIVSILQQNGHPNATQAFFFVNGYDSRTQGIDLVATTALPWREYGNFDLTASYNYGTNGIKSLLAHAPTGLPLIGAYSQTLYTTAQPRDKANLALDWKRNTSGATLRVTRYGKVTSEDQNGGDYGSPTDNFTQGAKFLTDLEYRYDAAKGLVLAVGSNNIFDVYPDAYPLKRNCNGSPVPTCSSTALDAVYPFGVVSPFGANGRFVYARVNYNW
jgi:iron complex outermembrane receptor protein